MDKHAEAEQQLQSALFDQVYLPRFKQACAQVGIEFGNDEDLLAGLETVAMLKMAEEQMREQGIDPKPSIKKEARDKLKVAIFGEDPKAQQVGLDSVKSALSNLLTVSQAPAQEPAPGSADVSADLAALIAPAVGANQDAA